MAVQKILLGNIKGPTGPQGPEGPCGPQGEQGPRGEQGLTGATGPQGEKGSQGDKGDAGPVGATGPQGPAGATGPQGPEGPQGIKGDTGHRGSRWVSGTMITGTDTTAKVYPTGIADSLANDHYLNVQTNHYYRCQTGGDENTATWIYVGTFSEAETAKLLNGLKAEEFVSNENLLINANFLDPVNSSGKTEWSGVETNVDEWWTGNSTSVVTLDENGLTFTKSTATYTWFSQNIAQSLDSLAGQTVTISAKINGVVASKTLTLPETLANDTVDTDGLWFNNCSINFYKVGTNSLQCRFLFNGSIGDTFTVEWVKLELGAVATPFIPPNKEVEMVKCGLKTKGTLTGLPTPPTAEGDYHVVSGNGTFPYSYGNVKIRYGSDSAEFSAVFESSGDDNRIYYNVYRQGAWVGWRDISDGGNADTVDNKHASDFVQRLPDQHGGDTVISASLTEFINAQVASGVNSGEFSFFNILYNERPSAGNAYGIVRFTKHLDSYITVWIRFENSLDEYITVYIYATNPVLDWQRRSNIADSVMGFGVNTDGKKGLATILQDYGIVEIGSIIDFHNAEGQDFAYRMVANSDGTLGVSGKIMGDADTVDGLHASDFQNKNDSRRLLQPSEYPTVTMDIRAFIHTKPSGHYTWDKSWSDNVIVPLNTTFIQIDWDRIILPDNGMAYGTLTLRSMIDNSEMATCSIFNNNQYTEWQSFLPLDGSVPMSGFLKASGGVCEVGGDGNHASIGVYNTPSDYSNSRRLMLMNSNYIPDHKDALQFWDNVNGAVTPYVLLHTGNSQKVATSPSAPSDTTALWVVPGN